MLPIPARRWQNPAESSGAASFAFACTALAGSKRMGVAHPRSAVIPGNCRSTPSDSRRPRNLFARLPFFAPPGAWASFRPCRRGAGRSGFTLAFAAGIVPVRCSHAGDRKWLKLLKSFRLSRLSACWPPAIPTPTCRMPESVPLRAMVLRQRPGATAPQAQPSGRPPVRSRMTQRLRFGNTGTARAIAPGQNHIQVIGAAVSGGLSFGLKRADAGGDAPGRRT